MMQTRILLLLCIGLIKTPLSRVQAFSVPSSSSAINTCKPDAISEPSHARCTSSSAGRRRRRAHSHLMEKIASGDNDTILSQEHEPLSMTTSIKDEENATMSSSLGTSVANEEHDGINGNAKGINGNIVVMSDDDETTEAKSLQTWLKDTLFLGIDPTPDVIAIATIYFVEGALGLARLAQTYLLKDELHLGPAELSALTGIFVLPWAIKPVYGFLSDGLPLFGYRRRSYLILAGMIGFMSYSVLGQNFFGLLQDDMIIPATVASLLISSACIAFSDVVADGIVVQKTRDSPDPALAGGLQSLCWGSAAIGGLLSAYFSGSLLEVMKPQDVFAITAVLPFLVALIAFLIDEKPINRNDAQAFVATNGDGDNVNGDLALQSTANGEAVAVTDDMPFNSIKDQISAMWDAIKQPSIYKPAAFLFLWQSTPTSDGAFFFFLSDELGFGPEFMGRVRLITAAASLFGVWLYNQYLKTTPIKDILFWSSIASVPLGLTSLLLITHANRALGIPDGAFVLGDDVILAVLGEIAFMPTLVLAARICPPGVEAVLFATLMSMYNFSGTLGTEIGAGLTKYLGVDQNNFDNLALLTVICNLSSLYPLLFIGWLDEVGEVSGDDLDNEEAETPKTVPSGGDL